MCKDIHPKSKKKPQTENQFNLEVLEIATSSKVGIT